MCPDLGGFSQRETPVNGPRSDDVPPPSTITRQIVHTLSTSNGHPHPKDRNSFDQLLREVLGSEDGASGQTSAIDHDSSANVSLITVVVQAGLDVLLQPDPFISSVQPESQAKSSIAVIRLIVKKTPDVLLLVSIGKTGVPVRPKLPYLYWLLPRLVRLLGNERAEGIQDDLVDLLKVILQVARSSPEMWSSTQTLHDYVKESVTGLISSLETCAAATPASSMEAKIPPSTFLEHVTDSTATNVYQVTIRGGRHVLLIVLRLMRTIYSAEETRDLSVDLVHGHETMISWGLDCVARICRILDDLQDFLRSNLQDDLFASLYLRVTQVLANMALIMPRRHIYSYKCISCLATTIAQVLQSSNGRLGSSIEDELSWALISMLRFSMPNRDANKPHIKRLVAVLTLRCSGETYSTTTGQDLKVIIDILLLTYGSDPMPLSASKQRVAIQSHHAEDVSCPKLQAAVRSLGLDGPRKQEHDTVRATKRRRVTPVPDTTGDDFLLQQLSDDIFQLLGSQSASDLDGLNLVAAGCFNNLTSQDQCTALNLLGAIPCVLSDSLSVERGIDGSISATRCSVCDSTGVRQAHAIGSNGVMEEISLTLKKLLGGNQLQRAMKPRVWAMLAIRRLLSHARDPNDLSLADSPFGQWCLQCHCSSMRELRVAAGCCGDHELNIALLQLVEYLGHTNPLVSGVAYTELQRLARLRAMPIVGLLSPFWRSIAPNVVKSLHSRPQIAQLLSDLLGVTVAGFLALTQSYTLPYLILYQKQSLILRILQARGDGSTVQSMCLENANLASTLALLLVQQSNDIETSTLTLLRHASAEFGGVDLADLVRSGPFYIAFELLLSAADEDAGARAKIHQAIHLLATLTHRRGTQSKSSSASAGGMVGAFFQTHVLGIMSHFAEVINAPREGQLAIEKKRCLKGIEEMIRLAKQHVANALPQICACLQSALEIAELRLQALSTWMTMVASLGDDDVEPMIDSIFSIIVQSWDNFSPIAKEQASAIIEHLVNRHRQYILENVDRVPSLSSVMELGKFETEIEKVRARLDIRQRYLAYSTRCRHENVTVVRQTLAELLPYLKQNQSFIHLSAVSEQPDPVIPDLLRSILDACVKFAETGPDISRLCSECIGLIGCSDPNRVEALREDREVVVLSNFDRADETIDWVMFFVQDIVVKAFMSATNTKGQGFLAWAMQELLKICDLDTSVVYRTRDAQNHPNLRRWYSLPESVRNTLTPFLNSKYVVSTAVAKQECQYPIFSPQLSHGTWLRTFVTDLLQKGIGDNARMIFPVCARIIRSQDISIASFLLPFVALNVVIGADEQQAERIGQEMLSVLQHQASQGSQAEKENLRLCSETVFHLLDYLSRWMQEKKKELASIKAHAGRHTGRLQADDDLALETAQIRRVEKLLSSIPAEDISRRAIECKSFARALFHWEQHIRQVRDKKHTRPGQPTLEALFERLQDIYTQIDEPDGIEGISAHLHVLNIDQQILEHRKAGRWTAAQSWYELRLAEQPDDLEIQASLLACLKESGQHDVLLNHVEGMNDLAIKAPRLLPFVVEAAWNVGKWSLLEKHLSRCPDRLKEDFNVGVGQALLNLRQEDHDGFISNVDRMRGGIANSLSRPTTASLQTCHDQLLKFHVLSEMELIGRKPEILDFDRSGLLEALDRRLEVLGAFLADKQYLLGVRRATMRLSGFPREDMASAWLTTAKLARKGGFVHQSFNAVLHASQLGAESATIEHSRLLWKEGQHRKAIQSLEGAIAVNAFKSYNRSTTEDASVSLASGADKQQNTLQARATLLLAKWLDSAGQTQSQSITEKYREAANLFMRWEKGHYYLGRHYDKLLASEKALPPHKQAMPFITGETAKLVVQNYLRSLGFGAKYIFQTLPRLLTLWLDLGSEATRPIDPKYGQKEEFRKRASADRKEQMQQLHVALKKYQAKLPAFVFYTALPQIVARICHPNKEVFAILQTIIVKVVSTHPQQALWTLLAVVKSSNKDRAARGATCLSMIKEQAKRGGGGAGNLDLKSLISQGQKLSEQLLGVCEGEIHGKPTNISLSKDLGFTQKSASCPMVVPLEKTLTASLPTVPDRMRGHKAFSRDTVTISGFLDEVLVLNSLQRPRKITVRGSDGRSYGLLCKPKDDLRKDQRLMEFNAMINRSLKRDADSSKRQLYIKTYAVTPLNEECGLIEWVDGLKTMRDILLKLYRSKSITPNYAELRILLDEIAADPSKISIFTDKILPSFPPVFHEWFVEMFPDPGAWFASRLRYTRSCAVMSMVGMVLGLGDRHGENILFEEGTGGTFHVDFNCLFDKGLTFDKPEMVPFRLTRNMVDAFGVYGYEGPFRKACELTLRILRQNEDTLMTILETFVYDPTTDFIGKKKRHTVDVPDTPQEVLDSVRGKVRGLLRGESVPLSVEGHVHELIQQAVSPANLAAMYIGWCAFL